MSRRTVNLLLLIAILAAVGLQSFAGRDTSAPNSEFLPEMVHSIPYDSFAPNPNFADGKTLQPPEPGTIARGQMPLHFLATPEDALRAGQELQNPMATTDAAARERGAVIFSRHCQVCHGAAGKGDGAVTQRGVPPPPSFLAEKALNMKDGQMFHVLTYGQGNMASYASQLSREDRWKVILHVRSLQLPAPGGAKP